MGGQISVSMMCANFLNIQKDLDLFKENSIEYLHIDVMDGHFVPNFTLGPDFVNEIRKGSDIPMDIHLMIEKPEDYIMSFNPKKGDIVCVHQETTYHLQRVLQLIKSTGAIPGVAINPATPLSTIEYVLDDVGMVLIMTVNPGFSGQKLVPQTLDKIKDLKDIIDKRNLDILIQVDGNVSFENAKKMREKGADIFVAGTSSIYKKDMDMKETTRLLRQAIK